MKIIVMPILLLIPLVAQSMCYTVYDASDKLLYQSTNSPVSLKGSSLREAVQQRFPGGAMIITNGICPPYDRAIAEAEERSKSAETQRRKAEAAEVARASAEQTAQVIAAQEASRAAIAARKKAEAAKEAEIQVAYEMARAAREADAQAARDAARVTKAPALLLPTSDAIYEGARKSLQAEKLKEREAAAAAERDDALPSPTHARNNGIGGAIGLVVWLLILGLAWGFLKSLFQKGKAQATLKSYHDASRPVEPPTPTPEKTAEASAGHQKTAKMQPASTPNPVPTSSSPPESGGGFGLGAILGLAASVGKEWWSNSHAIAQADGVIKNMTGFDPRQLHPSVYRAISEPIAERLKSGERLSDPEVTMLKLCSLYEVAVAAEDETLQQTFAKAVAKLRRIADDQIGPTVWLDTRARVPHA